MVVVQKHVTNRTDDDFMDYLEKRNDELRDLGIKTVPLGDG